jgi:membrane associated rhomboid family serine protease
VFDLYFFYYIPVGLDVKVERRANITYFLAGACILIYILYRYWPAVGGWNPYNLVFNPMSPSPATSLTYVFLHNGFIHLSFNMLYLVVFGRALEDRMGAGRFFLVFAISAMAGAYAHLGLSQLFAPRCLYSGVVGASGATSGLLGAFMVRFYFSHVRVAYWVFMPLQGINRVGRSGVPVLVAIVIWFVFQGVETILQYGTSSVRTAYSVHIGGFAAGTVLALACGARSRAELEKYLVRARNHFRKSNWFAARAKYLNYLRLNPCDGRVQAEVARTSICMDDRASAVEHYRKSVEFLNRSGSRGEAEEVFAEAMRMVPGFTMPEGVHLEMGCGMERSLKFKKALEAYHNFIWKYPDSPDSGFVLLRMSTILERRFEEPDKALRCLNHLIDEYPDDYWVNFAQFERSRLEKTFEYG